MSELKTRKQKEKSVAQFLKSVAHDKRRADATALNAIIKDIAGEKGKMWGESIVGFGSYKYTRKGQKDLHEWFVVGFSPRKAALVLYSPPCFPEYKDLVAALGKVKSSVSCTYITDLEKVDQKALKKLIKASIKAGKDLNEKKK